MKNQRQQFLAILESQTEHFTYYRSLFEGIKITSLNSKKSRKIALLQCFLEGDEYYGKPINSKAFFDGYSFKDVQEWIVVLETLPPSVQDILYENKLIYDIVTKDLESSQLEKIPKDYQKFFTKFLRKTQDVEYPMYYRMVLIPKDTLEADKIVNDILENIPIERKAMNYVQPSTFSVNIQNKKEREDFLKYFDTVSKCLTPQSIVEVRSTVDGK